MTGERGIAVAIALLLSAWDSPAAADRGGQPTVVLCHDKERRIVQEKLRQECDGRIVSPEQADRIRAEERRRRAKRLHRLEENKAPRPEPKDGPRFGTAFAAAPGGYVLTAAHVVADCREVHLEEDGGRPRYPAQIIARHDSVDTALLKAEGLASMPVGRAVQRPGAGAWVATVGFPEEGRVRIRPKKVTGRVREVAGMDPLLGLIAAEMPVRGGNSGGPLLDREGRLLGMVIAQLNTVSAFRETGTLMPDMAMAVPVSLLAAFLTNEGIADGLPAPNTSGDEGDTRDTPIFRVVCAR